MLRSPHRAPKAASRAMRTIMVCSFVTATLVLLAGLGLNREQSIASSVTITKPVTTVWNYVGDSERAHEWSIYFHHISPLPGDHPDGTVGSKRRCYRRADETGMFWDEVITAVEPMQFRHLTTYNTQGYGWADTILNQAVYHVQQNYRRLPGHRTALEFSVRGQNFVGRAVINLSYGATLAVFEQNLANIKAFLERGIVRAHPYDPHML